MGLREHRRQSGRSAESVQGQEMMGKVGRRHLEGRTKQERIVRKKLGPLQTLTVQTRTKVRCEAAREQFYAFLRTNQLVLPRKIQDLDPLVSEFIEHLWATGEGRSKANDTVAGLQDKNPKIRGCLPSSWRLLKIWSSTEIANRAPPLPEGVLLAMAGHALLNDQREFSLRLLIWFYSMLRTGELLGLPSIFNERTFPGRCHLSWADKGR